MLQQPKAEKSWLALPENRIKYFSAKPEVKMAGNASQ
jgi:hypothetical protein